MTSTHRRKCDTFRVVAAAVFVVAASALSQAAPVNHDAQRIVLRDQADARHDRAPCPSETAIPG